jgi:hypothetical protein
MILNYSRLTLIKIYKNAHMITWEKFDPLDFKQTFVLHDYNENFVITPNGYLEHKQLTNILK